MVVVVRLRVEISPDNPPRWRQGRRRMAAVLFISPCLELTRYSSRLVLLGSSRATRGKEHHVHVCGSDGCVE